MDKIRLEFRKFLLELSNDLAPQEVEKLKFLLEIPGSARNDMSEAFHVFHYLCQDEKLTPTDFAVLQDVLESVNRQDLRSKIDGKKDYFAESYIAESKKNPMNAHIGWKNACQAPPPQGISVEGDDVVTDAGPDASPSSLKCTTLLPYQPPPFAFTTAESSSDMSKQEQKEDEDNGMRKQKPKESEDTGFDFSTLGPLPAIDEHQMKALFERLTPLHSEPLFRPPNSHFNHRPQRPANQRYVKDDYVVWIGNAVRTVESTPDAFVVEMNNGSEFTININNSNSFDAEVDIEFGGRYLGCWHVEHFMVQDLKITGSAYEPGALTFYGRDEGLTPTKEVSADSIIKLEFKPDAHGLLVRGTFYPERPIALQRHAFLSQVFTAIEKNVGGGDFKVAMLVRPESERLHLNASDESDRQTRIDDLGFKVNERIIALSDNERVNVELPDGTVHKVAFRPLYGGLYEIIEAVAEITEVVKERVMIYYKNIPLRKEKMSPLVMAFAEETCPSLKAEIAEEFTVKLEGGSLPDGESRERKVHDFTLIYILLKELQEENLCSSNAKLSHEDKRLQHGNYHKTLKDSGVKSGSVIKMVEYKPSQSFDLDEKIKDGYDLNSMEDRSMDVYTQYRLPDKRFGKAHCHAYGDGDFGFDYSRPSRGFATRGFDDYLGIISLEGQRFDARKRYYEDLNREQKFEKFLKSTLIVKLISSQN
ncbi:uncharacterized protein LOC5520579 [Nematostella vectensis]|uniref:uncharacterized protein LOC5520579 n=1 Tax=Nematostella vectensis TaxID=45351 RepID=UPI00138FF175|nr:uncharacterized protein LOC5520579 [Nematostella vectensis]